MRNYSLSARPEATPRTPTAPLALRHGAVPRLWTAFVPYLGLQAASYWLVFVAGGPRALAPWLTGDAALFAYLVLIQAAIGVAAIIPARLSPEPVSTRLGLVRPGLPAWGYPILALASFVPWMVVLLLSIVVELLSGFGGGAHRPAAPMTEELAVPFVLFVALAPGVLEEVFFRGYIQRRLLQRWSPSVAILVSSLLFAAMHPTPHNSALAFVLGLWLGVLAWRTGSVWPGIVCHAVFNGTVFSGLQVLAGSSGDPPSDLVVLLLGVAFLGLIVLAVASFPVAVWLITRRRGGEPQAIGLPEPIAA
jgi:membrane protease YdiL (CAAX protease family)